MSPCQCGHALGQHEVRGNGNLGCYVMGCLCIDHQPPSATDPGAAALDVFLQWLQPRLEKWNPRPLERHHMTVAWMWVHVTPTPDPPTCGEGCGNPRRHFHYRYGWDAPWTAR